MPTLSLNNGFVTRTRTYKMTGRPSIYNANIHVAEVVQLSQLGLSVEQICDKWDISKKTYYNWRDTHEEFLHADTRAREARTAYWQGVGADNLSNKCFNDRLFALVFQNVTKESTRDRTFKIEGLDTCNTIPEMVACVMRFIARNELSIEEIQRLTSLFSSLISVDQYTTLSNAVKDIQEELKNGR